MEELPTVGDLVMFKEHCRPFYDQRKGVYLVVYDDGRYVRLHDSGAPVQGKIARENFDIVSAAR